MRAACASASSPSLELLLAACRNGDTQHVLGLLRQRASASRLNEAGNGGGDTPLIAACRFGHHELAIALLRLGANVNVPKEKGYTPLFVAAQFGHKDVVAELISHGANVEAAEVNGGTSLYVAAQNGHKDIVVELISHGANVEAVIVGGITPLYIAAQNGHKDVVAELISHGANVNAAQGSGATPLFIAAQIGHKDIVAELISHGANVEAAQVNGYTSLCVAAENGHKDIVAELISHGANVEAAEVDGGTPLYIAAKNGHKDIVAELISHGANVNAAQMNGFMPLFFAAMIGHKDIVAELISHGANVNAAQEDGITPLIIAAQFGHKDIVAELISHGANVNAAQVSGYTPLFVATLAGHKDVVAELISHGTNVNAAQMNGATPLYIAAQNGHKDIVAELISHGANVNATQVSGATPLYIAAQNGHKDIVAELISHGANVEAAAVDGATPLRIAAENGHKDIVAELISHGANVEAANRNGATPLYIAAQNGHKDIVAELISHGANVEAAEVDGFTPLRIAAQNGHKDIVAELISHGANVEAANKNGATSLYIAAQNGHKDVVAELILHGANVNAAQEDGYTPLFVAAEIGRRDIVVELISHGANVNAAAVDGYTPLYIAAQNGHKDVVAELISHGANVEAANRNGATPLYIAAEIGHKDIVAELISHGANVEAANRNGATPLYIAAEIGHKDIVVELISHGANVEAVIVGGITPLYIAAQNGHKDIVAELISHGANVNAAAVDGYTPLYIAAQNGHKDIVAELISHGADVEAANKNGATPLYIAALYGHVETVALLLEQLNVAPGGNGVGTSNQPIESRTGLLQIADTRFPGGVSKLEVTDAQGSTPLIAAARSGHFDVAKLLISKGASVNARASDGETVLGFAAQCRNLNAVSMLFDFGCLPLVSTSDDQATLLPATLEVLTDYGDSTHEFQRMWARVVDRLWKIYFLLREAPDTLQDDIFQFVMIVFHFARLKSLCSLSSVFARLVASQTIATRLRDFHTELTFLERRLHPDSSNSASTNWEVLCATDELELMALFREEIEGSATSKASQESEEGQAETASLLQHMMRVQGNQCSPELLDLLKLSLSQVQEAAKKQLSQAPNWFIPSHELDVPQVEESENANPVRGKWSSSAVMATFHRMQQDQFVEVFEKCIRLNHPNVVKVFGATHLRTPIVAVFENASNTNLREYLTYEENQHELWQKMHEVSLGLKYLIELEIIIESLRCDDIWIGTNGIAKVNALRCLTPAENSAARAQNVRWQAPEVVRGSSPSMASIIFSLGICVVEALTGKIPWGTDTNDMVSSKVVRGYRLELPEQATSAQMDLLKRMWLEDPSKRPTISTVVRHFKQFADEQSSKRSSHGKTKTGKIQPYDIQRFEFSELESTISSYLDKLKWRCKYYSESKEAVQHIFRRACDVYELLQTQHRLRNDVIVTSYCEVLVSLNRFLRNASHEKSVLLRAKSQKVALQSNVFHRKLDDLLELLAPATVDPVHVWTQQPTTPEVDIETGPDEEECNTSHNSQRDSNALAAATTKQEAVRIKLFESERPNMRFKPISAPTAPEHAPSLPSKRIDVHDLRYDSGSVIGTGAFGEVYKAAWLGTPVVIKFMGYEDDGDAYRDKLFFHELRVWEPLNHPHVVKLYGACEVGKRFFACEFMGNGTLAEYVKREGNETKTWHLLYQVALGLQYLHGLNILHNDLKCDNVLIATDGDAKITDFGLSSILNIAEVQVDPKKQGAQQWKSPEYIRGNRLTLASDIYSFGMLILEATTGKSPWGSTDDVSVRFQLRKGNLPLQPDCVSDLQWNLIQMMCAADPSRRVNIAFVVDKLYEFWQHQQDSNSKELPSPPTIP